MKKLLILGIVITIASAASGQIKFIASNLAGEDNSLNIKLDKNGRISFIEATFRPGPGITTIYARDIVEKKWELHDIGIVTSERIIQKNINCYEITARSSLGLTVWLENNAILLMIGKELYRISKPKDYLIEARPIDEQGKADELRRTAYGIKKSKTDSFIELIEKSWVPKFDAFSNDIDYEALCIPKKITFFGKTIQATVYPPDDENVAIYYYDYFFPLSKSRDVNLYNYLVLLTQRGDRIGEHPIIHPVLLTLLFFDALTDSDPGL